MPLRHIPLEKIEEAHLQALIVEKEREGKEIEYKREWFAAPEADKNRRELLFDMASFANAGGGDIVYGVETGSAESQGVPIKLVGLQGFVADAEELRLQELAKAWIAPRLVGTTCRKIPLGAGGEVFVVRVRPGIRPPHMVKFGGADRFYSRHTNGRYQLDVDEMRRMFLEGEGVQNRLRDFRLERIDSIIRKDTGIKTTPDYETSVVLHIQPVQPWDQFDFQAIAAVSAKSNSLRPIGDIRSFDAPWINFDGCISTSTDGRGCVRSYVQLFRDGALEAWCARWVHDDRVFLPSSYEEDLRCRFGGYIEALRTLGIPGPYLVGLTLINVRGLSLNGRIPFHRNVVVIPAQLMESPEEPIDTLLRPIFDRAWNACADLRSSNFDKDGHWIGRLL